MLSLLHALPPALCLAVPLFSAVLLVSLGRQQSDSLLVWSAILLFAVLASAAGIIGLNASSGLFSLSKAQLVVQTSLYTELGASVLYLTYRYNNPTPWHAARGHIKPYTLFLSAFLSCATILGLTTPFVPAIPAIIPPLIFMLFTLSTLPLLAHLIHSHLFARIYSPVSKSIQNQVPKQNLKPNPSSPSLPKLNTAITVLIPPPLPSPASSSASFPCSSDQTHKREKSSQDHYQNPTPGSSCSAAPPAKRAKLAESSCAADIEAGSSSGGTPESTSTPPSSGPVSRIREKAVRLRIQARNILLTLLLSQLCALLSGALLLVLGVTDGSFSQTTALLRIIETVFIVLCVCGFEFAFFLHARRLERSGASSIRNQGPPATTSIPLSISAPGQDQDILDADADDEDTNPQKTQDEEEAEDEEGAEVNLDMIPLPDAGDYTDKGATPTTKNVRGLGFGAQKRFRIFSGGAGDAISTRRHHRRFTSVSSSFSSPRPQSMSIAVPSGFDHTHAHGEKAIPFYFSQRQEEQEVVVEDEGIELPVLSKTTRRTKGAQLPSPPETPRVGDAGMDTRPGWYHHHYQLQPHHQYDQQFRQYGQQQLYDDQLYHHQRQRPGEEEDEEDEVRIGLASPEMRVNVHHHLIESSGTAAFLDVEHHTDVIDTAASEPGCMGGSRSSSSGSVFTGDRVEHVQGVGDPRSPRVLFSCPQRVPHTPTKAVLPKSPSLSFLSPVRSPSLLSFSLGSPRSPKLSILSGGSSPSTSRSAWRRAEKIRERLRRPLSSSVNSGSGSAGPARSASTSTSTSTGRGSGHRRHHRRNASLKMGEWEWYPFMSKAKTSREGAKEVWEEMDVAGAGSAAAVGANAIGGGMGGVGGTSARAGVVDTDTADFVDLTDPFASPTPGFALPKWVNSAATATAATGSVSDAGHASQGHGHGEEAGRSGKGKAKLEYDYVQEGEDNGEGEYEEVAADDDAVVRVGGALMKTRMTAWGKLPVIIDTFASSSGSGGEHGFGYGHVTYREEASRTVGTATVVDVPTLSRRDDTPSLMRRGPGQRRDEVVTPPRKEKTRRPDSPMPIKVTRSGSSSLSKAPARGSGRKERADSPMPMPMVDLGRVQGRASAFRTPLLVGQVARSQQQQQQLLVHFPVEDSEPVDGFGVGLSGSLSRGDEPRMLSTRRRRGRNGSPVPLKTSPTIRRKGSPVPILFRSSPGTGSRHYAESAVEGDENGTPNPRGWKKPLRGKERRQLEEREEVGLDLDLEEMLLAQRLLRRLDSVYSLESGGV